MSKYNNKKVYQYSNGSYTVGYKNGTPVMTFDSVKEFNRWCLLKTLEKGGVITGLERQTKFALIPTLRTFDGKPVRGVSYIADFVYTDKKGRRHVEDVKGVKTEVYKLKKKMMLYVYHIDVEEV